MNSPFPPLEKIIVSQLMIVREKGSFLLFKVKFHYEKLNAIYSIGDFQEDEKQ
jgi:hypothetical protein